ncbi:hypothetical protein PAMA_019771 [Pampus argenteus]
MQRCAHFTAVAAAHHRADLCPLERDFDLPQHKPNAETHQMMNPTDVQMRKQQAKHIFVCLVFAVGYWAVSDRPSGGSSSSSSSVNMACTGDADPFTAAIPATKVELTVSCSRQITVTFGHKRHQVYPPSKELTCCHVAVLKPDADLLRGRSMCHSRCCTFVRRRYLKLQLPCLGGCDVTGGISNVILMSRRDLSRECLMNDEALCSDLSVKRAF